MYSISKRECVLYLRSQSASRCSFHIVVVFCMPVVISSFKSLRAGSQVFALLMLFICVVLHTMWSGNSLFLCILALVCCACLSSV